MHTMTATRTHKRPFTKNERHKRATKERLGYAHTGTDKDAYTTTDKQPPPTTTQRYVFDGQEIGTDIYISMNIHICEYTYL